MAKKPKKQEVDNHSEQQARAQLESIQEMVATLQAAEGGVEPDGARDDAAYEAAEQTIHEDPLSVQVRYGWISPGATDDMIKDGPEEYEILLCTGGPACRIIGRIDQHNEPETAHIEHQDWGTPWTEHRMTSEEEETVLRYARCFYFGE